MFIQFNPPVFITLMPILPSRKAAEQCLLQRMRRMNYLRGITVPMMRTSIAAINAVACHA